MYKDVIRSTNEGIPAVKCLKGHPWGVWIALFKQAQSSECSFAADDAVCDNHSMYHYLEVHNTGTESCFVYHNAWIPFPK